MHRLFNFGKAERHQPEKAPRQIIVDKIDELQTTINKLESVLDQIEEDLIKMKPNAAKTRVKRAIRYLLIRKHTLENRVEHAYNQMNSLESNLHNIETVRTTVETNEIFKTSISSAKENAKYFASSEGFNELDDALDDFNEMQLAIEHSSEIRKPLVDFDVEESLNDFLMDDQPAKQTIVHDFPKIPKSTPKKSNVASSSSAAASVVRRKQQTTSIEKKQKSDLESYLM